MLKQNTSTRLRCILAEHGNKWFTGAHPHPETNWHDVMPKRRKNTTRFARFQNLTSFLSCSAAVSRAHQFFTLPLSLTQSVPVTIAPVWATCVIPFYICPVIHYPTHPFKEKSTSLCSSVVPSAFFFIHLPLFQGSLSCESLTVTCHPSSNVCNM